MPPALFVSYRVGDWLDLRLGEQANQKMLIN